MEITPVSGFLYHMVLVYLCSGHVQNRRTWVFFFFFATGSPMYIPVWFETLQSWHGQDCDPPRLAVS